MINDDLVNAHRARSLNPDRPVLRGTAQNPDVYFQARETVNPFYDACPQIVQRAMDRFASLTGRQYHLFDYYGAPDADRVVVLMGSSALAAEECVDALRARGERVGLINVICSGLFRRETWSTHCRRRFGRLPCSIEPRSRAARANPCTRMS